MNPKTVVLFIILVIYVFMGGLAIVQTIGADTTAPVFNDAYLFVATAVSGVMVTAFATAMNIQVPPQKGARTESRISLAMRRVGKFFQSLTPADFTKNYYVWAQIIMGGAAIIIWIAKTDVTPDVLKNIASLSVTMFVTVAMEAIKD